MISVQTSKMAAAQSEISEFSMQAMNSRLPDEMIYDYENYCVNHYQPGFEFIFINREKMANQLIKEIPKWLSAYLHQMLVKIIKSVDVQEIVWDKVSIDDIEALTDDDLSDIRNAAFVLLYKVDMFVSYELDEQVPYQTLNEIYCERMGIKFF